MKRRTFLTRVASVIGIVISAPVLATTLLTNQPVKKVDTYDAEGICLCCKRTSKLKIPKGVTRKQFETRVTCLCGKRGTTWVTWPKKLKYRGYVIQSVQLCWQCGSEELQNTHHDDICSHCGCAGNMQYIPCI